MPLTYERKPSLEIHARAEVAEAEARSGPFKVLHLHFAVTNVDETDTLGCFLLASLNVSREPKTAFIGAVVVMSGLRSSNRSRQQDDKH